MSRLLFIAISLIIAKGAFAEAQNVKTTEIIQAHVDHTVRTFGVLAPKVEDMTFQIPGRIRQFSVEEGDEVSKGDLLVELDTTDAQDQVRKTKTELDNARRLLDRMLALQSSGSIQVSQLEDAQAAFDQLQIAFDQANLNLERCMLKAPSNGVILKQVVDSRTSVSPGQPIFIFQSNDEQWITKVDLTDKNALLMSEGAHAEIHFSPYPNEIFKGRVTRVAQVANPSDGLYTAEVTIEPNGRELRPGMVAEVDMIKRSEREYSIVPFDALLDLRRRNGNIYVASSDGTKAVEVAVTINSVNGDQVSVFEDLSGFESVIYRGHQSLADESPILIAD